MSFVLDGSGFCVENISWVLTLLPLCSNVGQCKPQAIATGPLVPKKNRYLTFSTNNPGAQVAFKVQRNPPTAWTGYATLPINGISAVSTTPVFLNAWPRIISVGDCEISPVASYEIRATPDNIVFSTPLVVSTIVEPTLNGKKWGDVAGVNNGSEWTEPNMITNVTDIQALLSYISNASIKPTFPRANLQAVSSADPCLNAFVNTADVLILLKAVAGDPYPFTTNPASCPVCP